MVIYHAITTYQFLECLEHRKLFEKEEKAILLVPTFFIEKNPNYEQLIHNNIFDDIIPIPYHRISQDRATIISEVTNMFNTLLDTFIDDCDKFYIGGYQYYISIYLISIGKKFSIFEEAAGALSRIEILKAIDKSICEVRYEIIDEAGLYDTSNSSIICKYCDLNSQEASFSDDRAVNFEVVGNFGNLSELDQACILHFFGIEDKFVCESDSTLVLTQHFSNLGLLSFEEHILIYQMFADYFLNGEKLIFKLHPDDIMYYTKIFPGTECIKEKFPSELLPYVFEKLPKKLATISSTGYNLINQYFEEQFTLDFSYEKLFVHTHKYFALSSLLKYLGLKEVVAQDIYYKLLFELLSIQNHVMDIDIVDDITIYDGVCLIDSLPTDNRSNVVKICEWLLNRKPKLAIFVNSNLDYCFYDPLFSEVFNNMNLIKIQLIGKGQSDIEYLYVYSSNMQIVDILKDFHMKKELFNEEKTVSLGMLQSEERQIKILEGKLQAAEKRLLQYIEKEENNIKEKK